jgi:anti-sigma regulatory factor (Ser/Thr protein kinase)
LTRLRFSVSADNFSSAGSASTELKRALGKMGFDEALIRRIAIAMYEGEINMAIHAGGGEIGVEIGDGEIVVRLDDNGPGISDVAAAMREGFSTAPEKIHEYGFGAGMGLSNMKRNCDILDIAAKPDGGTLITMAFFFAQETKRAAPG